MPSSTLSPPARARAVPAAPRARRTCAPPTGVERTFGDHEIIVSKTDSTGHIRYVNEVFLRVSGFTRRELIGAPHSLIRHPDMPRTVFHLLWETLKSRRELFAYIVNLAENGDHYWVFAHVTPTIGRGGELLGYHSSRRTADRRALPAVQALYRALRAAERQVEAAGGTKRDAITAASALLARHLDERRQSYDEHVWSL